MTVAATITTSINDWLSSFTMLRKAIHQQGAQRFAALLTPFSQLEAGHPLGAVPQPGVVLNIVSGLHRGASMVLNRREYLLGSGEDCDIVLRDSAVEPHHCKLTREWFGFSICDLRNGKRQFLAPRTVNYRRDEIEAAYDVGGISFSLRQPVPSQSETTPEPAHRQPPWIALVAMSAGLAVTIGTFVSADRAITQAQLTLPQRIVSGNQALAAQDFGSIHLRQNLRGELEVAGLLTDGAQRRRLHEWLRRSRYGDANVAVQLLPELLEQVRYALAAQSLRVSLQAGRLRIEGKTAQRAVKDRIQTLAADLRGTVEVEDLVSYVEADSTPLPPTLPIKLRAVMVGHPSYFLTDRGVRYFVGGVLPDGAEVVAIDAQRIQFKRANEVLVYNLE